MYTGMGEYGGGGSYGERETSFTLFSLIRIAGVFVAVQWDIPNHHFHVAHFVALETIQDVALLCGKAWNGIIMHAPNLCNLCTVDRGRGLRLP